MDEESGRPPTICLFVQHGRRGQSLYKIELPVDLSEYEEDQLMDSKGSVTETKSVISPIFNFPDANVELLFSPEMVNLGSKIYFFGGLSHNELYLTRKDEKLLKAVHVLDMDQPEKGFCAVAPLNAAKEKPCVFVADGMIYALGSSIEVTTRLIPGCEATGCFERYDPNSDKWQVLPDPPLRHSSLIHTIWSGYATVIGRYVFFGSVKIYFRDEYNYVIYNLDSQKWEETPPRELAVRFPYGSVFVNGYLYHVRGGATYSSGTRVWDHSRYSSEPARIVKRGPFTIADGEGKGDSSSLLKSECLDFEKAQVLVRAGVLDDDHKFLFTKNEFHPWRSLIHLGGRYFCYVVTAQLVDWKKDVAYDVDLRCVRIKVFEEVICGKKDKAHMRLIASFLYRLRNVMPPRGLRNHIICCALGTIPNSWSMGPWKKKENREISLEDVYLKKIDTELENRDFTTGRSTTDESEGKWKVLEELASLQKLVADESEGKQKVLEELANLQKLLADREERINRLTNEIARKDEILGTMNWAKKQAQI